jgi:hypothetical protein
MAGLEILDAKYGAVGSTKDKKSVTENVKQKISADKQSVSFVVSTTNLGIQDPAPGNPKEMDIQYALDGIQYNEKIRDGNTFAAKLKEPAPRSPAGYLLMLYGAIFKNVVSSAALCINVAGIVMAYNLGWYFGFGVLWAIIAVIFPFAAFWLIPFIVIIARAAGGVDFVTLY